MTTALVGLGTLTVAAHATADPATHGCPNLTVVAVPGTWETSDTPTPSSRGLLGAITDQLTGSVNVQQVTYSATAFPWEHEIYAQSEREAVDHTRTAVTSVLAQCPDTTIALLGYSQGADAVGDLAVEIGTGQSTIAPDRIAAVALIADPQRSVTDTLVGAPVPGNGAEGPRPTGFGALTSRVRTVCAPGDLYCSVPSDDFVDRLAGLVVRMSAPTASDPHTDSVQVRAIVDDLDEQGGIGTLFAQLSQQLTPERVAQVRQFFTSHVHQNYSTYPVDGQGTTATTWLTQWLNQHTQQTH
ncbi:cutinase family protein [Rhodococcus jostii]|uniref:cutinase family protein n=1 Tax=Rhodococcus jostii TaxID=132919 RepID=UPI00363C69E4